MRVYECRYVRKDDPGDLLWGFHWRPAVIVDERCLYHDYPFMGLTHEEIEACMFDKETGENVGDTRNYCINPTCYHEDCAPMTLLYDEGRPARSVP